MNVTFANPGVDYMLQQIILVQAEYESAYWTEPLYGFYPQLDKAYANSLSFTDRKSYIERTLRAAYGDLEDIIQEKVAAYSRHWANCREQITLALSDAFQVDCADILNDLLWIL